MRQIALGFFTICGLGCGTVKSTAVDANPPTEDGATKTDGARPADDAGSEATVTSIQMGTISEGTEVLLKDVVVTARNADGRNFWVQDSGGAAPFNGIYIFRGVSAGPLPSNVEIGNVVTVTGRVLEFGGELTEVAMAEVTVADGSILPVAVLSGVAIGDLASQEQYEGVLVEISGAVIATPPILSCDMFCTFTFAATPAPLVASDQVHRHTTPAASECYSVTGIMDYSTFSNRIEIAPLESGMVSNGPGCT